MRVSITRLSAAAMVALTLQAGAAWAGPQDPPQPKSSPVDGGHRWPEIPPPPCAGGFEPGPIIDCGRYMRPPCCCAGYEAAIRCPDLWPELTPPRRDPPPPRTDSHGRSPGG